MELKRLKAAIRSIKNIQGWFKEEAATLIAIVDEYQKTHKVQGNIFEIGVHHGKSSVLFSHLIRESEALYVCDLFDEQGNVSKSGRGDEEIFITNMKKYGKVVPEKIFKCFSSDLKTNEIGSNYRLFHIDGGHNTDEALADLELSALTLIPDGVIIVDDPFRDEWPGVTEAIILFVQAHPEFEVIAVGFNKLFLGRRSVASSYRSWIQSRISDYGLKFPCESKIVPFAGSNMLSIFISQRYLKMNWKGNLRKLLSNY